MRTIAAGFIARFTGTGRDRRTLLFAVLLASAAASLIAATDRASVDAGAVTIPYGDLDLNTIEGAHLLEQRLIEAASAVCRDLESPAVPAETYDRCRMDAVSGAILMLRRPPSALATVTS